MAKVRWTLITAEHVHDVSRIHSETGFLEHLSRFAAHQALRVSSQAMLTSAAGGQTGHGGVHV